jgi:hypothetical protein
MTIDIRRVVAVGAIHPWKAFWPMKPFDELFQPVAGPTKDRPAIRIL